MRLSAFSNIPRLLAVSLLGLMILSPANAQTSSESEGRELGAFALGAGTINPGTPETGPNAATPTQRPMRKSNLTQAPVLDSPTPKTNEKVESEPAHSLIRSCGDPDPRDR